MQDFNDYVQNNSQNFNGENGNSNQPSGGNVFDIVNSIAKKFDGKNQNDLLKAIYEEALRGKRNGTLSNSDIDNFVAVLSPALDNKQRKILQKISEELKRL